MSKLKNLCFVLCLSLFTVFSLFGQKTSPAKNEEVTIGKPEFIPYDRAFSLLDGLFQDVSAIQVASLSMNANAPNASQLDAIIQQFQANLQFSQTAGIQNQSALRQSAAFASQLAFDSQLMNQESQLLNLLPNALQQVNDALIAKDSLPATATEAEKKAATDRFNAANSYLTTLKGQIDTIKNLRKDVSSPASSAFANPAPSPAASPPTPSLTPSIPSLAKKDDNTSAVSFPPSKQMENQINLLWERLANLLGTMSQVQPEGNVFLVRFNTDFLVGKDRKKTPLLSTQFGFVCKDNSGNTIANKKPMVLDLFPRNAAVNIANQKYRDSRFGISWIAGFFSFGMNAAYNREHLRITQSLSQSSYITGYGIRNDTFGWVFGPALGEDIVSPGPRTTFALISVPEGCKKVTVKLENAVWSKSPVRETTPTGTTVKAENEQTVETPTGFDCASSNKRECLKSLTYASTEFEPNGQANSASDVTLDFVFSDGVLDRDQTVTVNGILLKRTVDGGGRASSGNVLGLFQANASNAGSWFPVNKNEMIIKLNPRDFPDQFPRIILNSPRGSIDVTDQIGTKTKLLIDGRIFLCPTDSTKPCELVLPSLGKVRTTLKRITATRWIQANNNIHILFKIQEDARPITNPVSNIQLLPIQIAKGGNNQPWSSHTKVIALQKNNAYALDCLPFGEYLNCKTLDDPAKRVDTATKKLEIKEQTEFEIYDQDYFGGVIKGASIIQDCTTEPTCEDPFILNYDPIEWDNGSSSWIFRADLVNVQDGWNASLIGGTTFSGIIKCLGSNAGKNCQVEIPLPKSKFDDIKNRMEFKVDNAGTTIGSPSIISNLKWAVTPILSSISKDFQTIKGVNLVFDKLIFDKTGKTYTYSCSTQQYCQLNDDIKNAKGFLFFVAGPEFVPFWYQSEKGLMLIDPKPAPAENKPVEAKPQTASPEQIQIQLNNVLKIEKIQP